MSDVFAEIYFKGFSGGLFVTSLIIAFKTLYDFQADPSDIVDTRRRNGFWIFGGIVGLSGWVVAFFTKEPAWIVGYIGYFIFVSCIIVALGSFIEWIKSHHQPSGYENEVTKTRWLWIGGTWVASILLLITAAFL